MRRDLASWPAGRMAQMGICYRTRQSTRLAFLRLLSSPVGLGSDKLLVHVSLDSGSVELFDIRIITVNKCINLRPAVISCLPAADLLDGPQVDDSTAWEIGYFYARKSSGQKIIGIRTDFRRAGESSGAVVNAMIECSCDWIVKSTKGLLEEVSRFF